MSDFGFANDDHGREILVGLSVQETEFCSLYRHKLLLMEYLSKEEKVRYRDLMARHDQHRLQIRDTTEEKKDRQAPL